ncbi:UDP-glucose:undecaprenyl-phosphate glucose-1-phosphate transferase [Caprobacter fermentans]|uniref:UDP-glucose:undecaprenyl-phosphate glucose-1-phosphate transferase n=1 Tax=Caproicibacter fermentans TaxID=2576756 RepID=A0A6N8HYX7_9FIRM|nr:sugar transferase [Caproicibacter fermentans]MVB10730.1 UDP-glucose:undecaprenyl-phosphate glucose-1-phosphate transferase [Caproicibacter fermentans]
MNRDVTFQAATAACEVPAQAYPLLSENRTQAYEFFKRFFDITLSIMGIVFLLPLFFLTACAIKLDSRGPVIYTQMRAGRNGKPFKLYKFRSMCPDAEEQLKNIRYLNEADGPVFKISNDPRVTRVGRFIRKGSIDELPQLINILKGEMSIVGPRPPLFREVEQYTPYQMQRLRVTPGLTCYWQISGRSNVSFERWVSLDLQYIRERCLWIDFKTILKTVPAVLFGMGAY